MSTAQSAVCGTATQNIAATDLGAVPPDTVQLATDGAAVYGITAHNSVWAFRDGRLTSLVTNDDSIEFPSRYPSILAAGGHLFWLDRLRGVVHRTRTDGTLDEQLATVVAPHTYLAADRQRLYWAENPYMSEGRGVIRAVALDAAPGTVPSHGPTLGASTMIGSLASTDGRLYWTQFFSDTTMPRPVIWTAASDALFNEGAAAASSIPESAGCGLFPTPRAIYAVCQNGSSGREVRTIDPNAGGLRQVGTLDAAVSTLAGVATTPSSLVVSGANRDGISLYVSSHATFVALDCKASTAAVGLGDGVAVVTSAGRLIALSDADLTLIH
ncbi:MAG: hypothetical protein ACJ8F1_08040 [Polyangia bacterium]